MCLGRGPDPNRDELSELHARAQTCEYYRATSRGHILNPGHRWPDCFHRPRQLYSPSRHPRYHRQSHVGDRRSATDSDQRWCGIPVRRLRNRRHLSQPHKQGESCNRLCDRHGERSYKSKLPRWKSDKGRFDSRLDGKRNRNGNEFTRRDQLSHWSLRRPVQCWGYGSTHGYAQHRFNLRHLDRLRLDQRKHVLCIDRDREYPGEREL